MIFFKKRKNKIQDMKDLEAKLWTLIKDNKLTIPANISQLRTICGTELNDLKEEKNLIESKYMEDIKSGKIEISSKFNKLIEEIVNLRNLLISQNNLISPEIISKLSDDKLKEYLQGNSQSLSETSLQINKLLEIIEVDSSELETISNETRTMNSRFIVKTDTIYDTKTKLTWDRDFSKSGKINWDKAMYCSKSKNKFVPSREDFWNLNHEPGTYVGFTIDGYVKSKDLKEIGFLNVKKDGYWTSNESGVDYVFLVAINIGNSYLIAKNYLSYAIYISRN